LEQQTMFFLMIAAQAAQPAFEDLPALDRRIAAEAGEAEPIDGRLRLARCPEQATIQRASGTALVVRCPALGWRVQVSLKKAVTTAAKSEIVIRKGQLVECVAKGTGFSVTTMMIALEDAIEGHPVRVKSPTSAVTMTGTVGADGIIRL
jgi:flagellar basal body P-ring formation protein FlgA